MKPDSAPLCRRRKMFSRVYAAGALTVGSLATVAALSSVAGGCPAERENPIIGNRFANASDKTNGGAAFVGSAACAQCHTQQAAAHRSHAHAAALSAITGGPPSFVNQGDTGGVPQPPTGLAWSDISYVLGGYADGAAFVDQSGALILDSVSGVPARWRLPFVAGGVAAGMVGDGAARTPLEFADFAPFTTGPQPFDQSQPQSQGNRPQIRGTWHEDGAQCEACHGPGGGHFGTVGGNVQIDRTRIFVDPTGSQSCAACHSQPYATTSGEILASGGYVIGRQQWSELRASGGHAQFSCTICHDPHEPLNPTTGGGIRNACGACHTNQSMAGHGGAVFRIGDHVEPLTCESCHMPYAARTAGAAAPELLGANGRMGDSRTHIFRIDTTQGRIDAMFTVDGSRVIRDAQGRAGVTAAFVCLRCHNGVGEFALRPERAAEIGSRVHGLP